jgi:hypothetical protein
MDIRILAASLSEPLGAPNTITISDASSTAVDDTAGVVFNSTGTFARYVSGLLITEGNWITPQTNMSSYEIRFTSSTGDAPTGGTLDTWLSLGTTQSITMTAGFEELLNGTVLAEIRWTGNNEVQDSATYTLGALGPT